MLRTRAASPDLQYPLYLWLAAGECEVSNCSKKTRELLNGCLVNLCILAERRSDLDKAAEINDRFGIIVCGKRYQPKRLNTLTVRKCRPVRIVRH